MTLITGILPAAHRTRLERQGLRKAPAGCPAGNVLAFTKHDRRAKSRRNDTGVGDVFTKRRRLNLEVAVYDPTVPLSRILMNVLGTVARLEADVVRDCTREGMAIAKAAGNLCGRKPELTPMQNKPLV